MKKKGSISLGPGAPSLILIFVVLSLSVLGMLSLMGSRNDLRLSERSARVVETVYREHEAAENRRAELSRLLAECGADAADDQAWLEAVARRLPEDMSLTGRTVSWTRLVAYEGQNSLRQLDFAVALAPLGETPRTKWIRYDMAAATEDAPLALYARLTGAGGAVPGQTRTEVTSSWDSETPYALTGTLVSAGDENTAPVWDSCWLKPVTDAETLQLMEQADERWDALTEAASLAAEAVLEGSYTDVEAAGAAWEEAVRAALPGGMTMDGAEIAWTESGEGLRLECRAELQALWSDDPVLWLSRALVREGSAD